MTARNEPMRDVMNAASDPTVETIVVMSGAQCGKTESLNNVIGAMIDLDPCPILVVNPTLEMAETISKDRLAPMFRDTPCLRTKVADGKSRDSGNTLLRKSFPGGQITLAGANSPASLASRPVRLVLCDEVDRFPFSAGVEGDPVLLAKKRTLTFWNRKVILTSTPTVKGASRIEQEFEQSDKRRFFIPCPDCDHEQTLRWENVKWPEGKPREAVYVCEECGVCWDDAKRWGLLRKGRWAATAPFNGTAGFHLNQIYSPWSPLGSMAADFMASKDNPETLRVFVNTALGEPWEDQGDRVDSGGMLGRLEDWGQFAPDRVLLVTAGIDVQDDRFEIERVGWSQDEESYSVDYKIMYVDPSSPEAWRELDEYLRTPTITSDGRSLPISAACIDSGGHHTNAVYDFVRVRARSKIWAIKGVAGSNKPIWPKKASRNNKGKINLFPVGVDTAKDSIYARLRIKEPGAGYCHFPVGREKSYFDQLTAEKCITEYHKGFPRRVWVKSSGARNEALDCRVYAYAALHSLNVNWSRELKLREKAARVVLPEIDNEVEAEESTVETTVPVPMPASTVQKFRRRWAPSNYLGR